MDIHLQIKSRNFPKQSNVQVVSFVMPPIQLVMNAYLCASFETRNKLSSFRKILNVLLCTMNLMHWKLASGKQKRTMPNRDAFFTTKFGLFPDHFLKREPSEVTACMVLIEKQWLSLKWILVDWG